MSDPPAPPPPPPPPGSERDDGAGYTLHGSDIAVIVCYFATLLSIAFVPAVWSCLPRHWTHAAETWWRRKFRLSGPGRRHRHSPSGKRAGLLADADHGGGQRGTAYGSADDGDGSGSSTTGGDDDDDDDGNDGNGGSDEAEWEWDPRGHDPGAYFLADSDMPWAAVTASLFSSNIGSEHFIGLSGDGARTGYAVASYELSAGVMLIALGWVFAPVYLDLGVFTMPEFLQRRYGGERLKLFITLLSLGLYAFTKVAATLYAGGIILDYLLGWNVYVSAIAMIVVTAVYTAIGGLKTVVYTECFQTVTLLVGGLVVCGVSMQRVGGMQGLHSYVCDDSRPSWNASCGCCDGNDAPLAPGMLSLIRPAWDPDFPWTGFLFGIWCGSIWYWCADQEIVQRTLCARDERHARIGSLGAALLKTTPMFFMVVPGVVCRALYPELIEREGTDVAYPILITKVLPPGAVGLVVAAMLSALMSTLASVFNSSSTLFTMDVWRRVHPGASDRTLVHVGRVAVAVMAAISVAWVPIIRNATSLFIYVQSVSNYLAPPITCIFVAAFVFPSVPEHAAFWGVVVGETVGVTRLVLELVRANTCDDESDCATLDSPFVTMNYLHFACVNSAIVWTVIGALTARHKRSGGSAGSHDLTTFKNPLASAGDERGDAAGSTDEREAAAGAARTAAGCDAELASKVGLGVIWTRVKRTAMGEWESVSLSVAVLSITVALYIAYR